MVTQKTGVTGSLFSMAVLATAIALTVFGIGDNVSAAAGDHLTFSRATALPGVVLPSGEYIFERASPGTSANIVRVRDAKRNVRFMGYTVEVQRPNRRGATDRVVEFGEAPAGQPVPIKVWYPIGSGSGYAVRW